MQGKGKGKGAQDGSLLLRLHAPSDALPDWRLYLEPVTSGDAATLQRVPQAAADVTAPMMPTALKTRPLCATSPYATPGQL